MKTITIYELIKLIKEDKAPKKVKYNETFYIYNKKLQDYTDINENYLIYKICNEIHCWLDEKVEIIEEDKKIDNCRCYENFDGIDDYIEHLRKQIDNLIDVVNDLKKEGKIMKQYIISEKNLKELINDSWELTRLINNGVDNCEGYYDKRFIEKYEELLNKGYCNCNEMNCIDNNSPRRILNIVKQQQKNWKELKEYIEMERMDHFYPRPLFCDELLKKMQELEKGKSE